MFHSFTGFKARRDHKDIKSDLMYVADHSVLFKCSCIKTKDFIRLHRKTKLGKLNCAANREQEGAK